MMTDHPIDAAARHIYAAQACHDAGLAFSAEEPERAAALFAAETFFLGLGEQCLAEVAHFPSQPGDPGGDIYPTKG